MQKKLSDFLKHLFPWKKEDKKTKTKKTPNYRKSSIGSSPPKYLAELEQWDFGSSILDVTGCLMSPAWSPRGSFPESNTVCSPPGSCLNAAPSTRLCRASHYSFFFFWLAYNGLLGEKLEGLWAILEEGALKKQTLACEKTSRAVLQWHQPVALLPAPNINSSNTRLLSTVLKGQRIFCLVREAWEQSCFKCSGIALAPGVGRGKWGWEAALGVSGFEMRRMLSREVYVQRFRAGGKKTQQWRRKVTLYLCPRKRGRTRS